eukprot:tig00000523_g1840.t1
MGIFTQRKTVYEQYSSKLDRNPVYPFKKLNDNVYRYEVRYSRFWVALVFLVLGLIGMIFCGIAGAVFQAYFVMTVGVTIFSLGTVYSYKDMREYVLDGNAKQYIFRIGKKEVTRGEYHNVYIRVRKRFDAGRMYYYLIFNGYRIDKQIISGTSRKMEEMRELGQRLAEGLGINYFDEANVSQHHVVRHRRPEKRVPISGFGGGTGNDDSITRRLLGGLGRAISALGGTAVHRTNSGSQRALPSGSPAPPGARVAPEPDRGAREVPMP